MSAPPESLRIGALGALFGATLGALVVAGLATASLGFGQPTVESAELAPWIAAIVLVIVAQFGVAGALCATALAPAGARRGT